MRKGRKPSLPILVAILGVLLLLSDIKSAELKAYGYFTTRNVEIPNNGFKSLPEDDISFEAFSPAPNVNVRPKHLTKRHMMPFRTKASFAQIAGFEIIGSNMLRFYDYEKVEFGTISDLTDGIYYKGLYTFNFEDGEKLGADAYFAVNSIKGAYFGVVYNSKVPSKSYVLKRTMDAQIQKQVFPKLDFDDFLDFSSMEKSIYGYGNNFSVVFLSQATATKPITWQINLLETNMKKDLSELTLTSIFSTEDFSKQPKFIRWNRPGHSFYILFRIENQMDVLNLYEIIRADTVSVKLVKSQNLLTGNSFLEVFHQEAFTFSPDSRVVSSFWFEGKDEKTGVYSLQGYDGVKPTKLRRSEDGILHVYGLSSDSSKSKIINFRQISLFGRDAPIHSSIPALVSYFTSISIKNYKGPSTDSMLLLGLKDSSLSDNSLQAFDLNVFGPHVFIDYELATGSFSQNFNLNYSYRDLDNKKTVQKSVPVYLKISKNYQKVKTALPNTDKLNLTKGDIPLSELVTISNSCPMNISVGSPGVTMVPQFSPDSAKVLYSQYMRGSTQMDKYLFGSNGDSIIIVDTNSEDKKPLVNGPENCRATRYYAQKTLDEKNPTLVFYCLCMDDNVSVGTRSIFLASKKGSSQFVTHSNSFDSSEIEDVKIIPIDSTRIVIVGAKLSSRSFLSLTVYDLSTMKSSEPFLFESRISAMRPSWEVFLINGFVNVVLSNQYSTNQYTVSFTVSADSKISFAAKNEIKEFPWYELYSENARLACHKKGNLSQIDCAYTRNGPSFSSFFTLLLANPSDENVERNNLSKKSSLISKQTTAPVFEASAAMNINNFPSTNYTGAYIDSKYVILSCQNQFGNQWGLWKNNFWMLIYKRNDDKDYKNPSSIVISESAEPFFPLMVKLQSDDKLSLKGKVSDSEVEFLFTGASFQNQMVQYSTAASHLEIEDPSKINLTSKLTFMGVAGFVDSGIQLDTFFNDIPAHNKGDDGKDPEKHWIIYLIIGLGAAVLIGLVVFLIWRYKSSNKETGNDDYIKAHETYASDNYSQNGTTKMDRYSEGSEV